MKKVPTSNRVSPGRRKKRWGILHWFFLFLGLALFGSSLWQLWQDKIIIDKQIARLKEEKRQLIEQQENLKAEINLLNTPSYIEQLAREQLGLVRRGEIMIAPKK